MALVLRVSLDDQCERLIALNEDSSFLYLEAVIYHAFNLSDQRYHLFKLGEKSFLAPAFDDFESDGQADYYVKTIRDENNKSITEDIKIKKMIEMNKEFKYLFYGLDYNFEFNVKRIKNDEVELNKDGYNIFKKMGELPSILS